MNEELVSRFVDSIIYRAGRVVIRDGDDPRIATGELITEKEARRLLTPDVRNSLIESEREMERSIRDAFVQGLRNSSNPKQ